mmetsp:Transcript_14557/g.41885  ORF Transcript_14557/g.41885 Transcript_14557/m.41885 type:complete len:82 (+) Transcript_14557:56-301(+)
MERLAFRLIEIGMRASRWADYVMTYVGRKEQDAYALFGSRLLKMYLSIAHSKGDATFELVEQVHINPTSTSHQLPPSNRIA